MLVVLRLCCAQSPPQTTFPGHQQGIHHNGLVRVTGTLNKQSTLHPAAHSLLPSNYTLPQPRSMSLPCDCFLCVPVPVLQPSTPPLTAAQQRAAVDRLASPPPSRGSSAARSVWTREGDSGTSGAAGLFGWTAGSVAAGGIATGPRSPRIAPSPTPSEALAAADSRSGESGGAGGAGGRGRAASAIAGRPVAARPKVPRPQPGSSGSASVGAGGGWDAR
jgi:hypothetical protein